MALLTVLAVSWVSALIMPSLAGSRSPAIRAGMALPSLALFALLLSQAPTIAGGQPVVTEIQWIPSLGVNLDLRLDGLSLLFGLLITGIGTVIFLYAARYMHDVAQRGRFFVTLAAFQAAMLGAVLSDNMLVMLVFWELTSLTSFLLVGFNSELETSRRSALQGLLVTVAGGLALLVGVVILGGLAGTFSISGILSQPPEMLDNPLGVAALLCVAAGAFSKSAQFPLHFWLPNAMSAPTPVSAYLHSATMVKLGVYLLARMHPLAGGIDYWIIMLSVFGAATMLVGAFLALRETDLKRILAYSTIVSLGTAVALLGTGQPLAPIAVVAFLIVHALYKACLFLVAGIIDHETGTRDASQLRGLGRTMPWTAGIAILGCLSMAGLPPFVGFVSKELVYEAKLESAMPLAMTLVAYLANVVMVVISGIVAARVFFGKPTPTPKKPHDPPIEMLLGPILLACLGVVFGIAPALIGGLVEPAASAIAGTTVSYNLVLWHGLTPVFWLSVATVIAGILVFLRWDLVRTRLSAVRAVDERGPEASYEWLMNRMLAVAAWQTRSLQHGSLRRYMWACMAVTLVVTAVPMLWGGLAWPGIAPPPSLLALAVPVLLVVGGVVAVRAHGVFAGVMAVGLVGYGLALAFLTLGAPDVALTQFSVETLFIVLLAGVLLRLPYREPEHRSVREQRADAALSIGIGTVVTLMLLAMLATPFDPTIGEYYNAASMAAAHGRNAVNVILVDFRALDTLGEIAVLGLAALAVFAVRQSMRQTEKENP